MSFQLYTMSLLVVCLIVIIKSVMTFTGHSCPPPLMSTSVAAKACNDSSEYHCLYNGRSKLYESYCFKAKGFPAGSYVLQEGGLESKSCSDERYQPTVYLSNQYNSKCIYSKTNCSQEGQVVHDSSLSEKDRTCRCDYTQGYDFVTLPRHRCFCIPTEEDCSCYKKQCPENTTLTPDYKCLKTVGLITCSVIKHKGDEPGDNTVVNRHEDLSLAHNTISYKSGFQRWFLLCVVAGMVLLLLIGCIIVIRSQDMNEECGSLGEKSNFEDDSNSTGYTLITRNGFQQSIEALEKYRLVVIKGRYGTGKSFMANQIAQRFPDYKTRVVQKEDLSKLINVSTDGQNQIIIFDEVCCVYEDEKGRSTIIKVIETFFVESSNLLIITVGEFNNVFIDSLRKLSLAGDGNLIDLDTEFALSKEEKLCLLTHYLKQLEDKLGDRSSLLASLLPKIVKEEILSTDTYHEFPLLCKTFFSELNNIKLGPKYFRQPPQELIDQIERIRVATSAKDESSRIQYSILIYILLSTEGCINIHGIHSELMHEIGGYFFGLVFFYKDFIRSLQMEDIPLQRFLNHVGDGKYTMHPSVYQAVLFSFRQLRSNKVVEKCKLEHVLDLYRMPNYEPLPNELVILCNKENVKTFCEIVSKRMADVSLLDDASAHMVCHYIVETQYDYLSQQYFTDLQEEMRNYITSKRVHLMLIIFKELVLDANCRNVKNNQCVAVWSALVYNKYGKYSLIAELMKISVFSTTKTIPLAMFSTIVDEYDNNMLTYCILWWNTDSEHPFVMAVSNLLSQSLKNLSFGNLFTHKKEGVSPIDFAAYFGRFQCLQMFLPWQERDAKGDLLSKAAFHKLRNQTEELIELARKGEKKLILDKIKYNTEICPRVEIGTDIDYEKTHIVLKEFREKLARHHKESNN